MRYVRQSYYEILDVDPAANDDEVRRAYRLVRSSFEPDTAAIYSLYSPEETEAIGAKIDEAFRILLDRDRRRSYDAYLEYGEGKDSLPGDPDEFFDQVHEPPSLYSLEEYVRGTASRVVSSDADGGEAEAEDEEVEEVAAPVELELPFGDGEADTSLERVVDGPEPEDHPESSFPFVEQVSADEPEESDTQDDLPSVETTPTSTPRLRSWSREYSAAYRQEQSLDLEPIRDGVMKGISEADEVTGRMLKLLREQRGIELQTVSELTKISIMYLRFIEQDNYENLPPRIYLKGFVEHVVRLLQLPRELVERYMRHVQRHGG